MPLRCACAVSLCCPARRSVRHLIGGIVAALACAITLVPLPEGVASSLLPGSGFNRVVNSIALHLQFYVYILLMGVVLAQYRLAYRQSHSNPATLTFKWLAVVVGEIGRASCRERVCQSV